MAGMEYFRRAGLQEIRGGKNFPHVGIAISRVVVWQIWGEYYRHISIFLIRILGFINLNLPRRER